MSEAEMRFREEVLRLKSELFNANERAREHERKVERRDESLALADHHLRELGTELAHALASLRKWQERALDEREACAKLAETFAPRPQREAETGAIYARAVAFQIAGLIRDRKPAP